jgi:hypothetical protein
MKNATFLLSILASAILAGCSGISPTLVVGDTVAAAGGALIGNKLSHGNPLITAASAGGGVLLSESLQAGSKASSDKAYDAGYEKARSDSAKQQFQTLIDRQRTGPQLDDRGHVRLLEVPLPERPGERRHPRAEHCNDSHPDQTLTQLQEPRMFFRLCNTLETVCIRGSRKRSRRHLVHSSNVSKIRIASTARPRMARATFRLLLTTETDRGYASSGKATS